GERGGHLRVGLAFARAQRSMLAIAEGLAGSFEPECRLAGEEGGIEVRRNDQAVRPGRRRVDHEDKFGQRLPEPFERDRLDRDRIARPSAPFPPSHPRPPPPTPPAAPT